MLFNLEDWENIIHFGHLFASIGKKHTFLALGMIPVTGVGFIARKITAMDESFEISAVDGSFHEEQEVGSQYECNECTYKTCFKQNLKRHKHAKHPIPVATTPAQAVV